MHELANRLYKGNNEPWVQQAILEARNTVETETPEQRSTNTALFTVNQAGDRLNTLLAGQANGAAVAPADIQAARDTLTNSRRTLLGNVENELQGVSITAQNRNPDWRQSVVGSRYVDDPELQASVQAAGIVDQVLYTRAVGGSPIAVMQQLDRLTPASLAPTARELVMSSTRTEPDGTQVSIQGVVNDYVGAAGSSVTQTLQDKGPAAAAARLRELTEGDPAIPSATMREPAVSARVINKLLDDGTMSKMFHNLESDSKARGHAPGGKAGGEPSPSGYHPNQTDIYAALADVAASVDAAAAGSDAATGRWTPDEAKAVQGVAKTFVENQSRSDVFGVTSEAARSGYITLGLEISRQIKALPPGDAYLKDAIREKRTGKLLDATPEKMATMTLAGIADGLSSFREDAQDKMKGAMENLGAVLNPAGRHAGVDNGDQIEAGIKQIVNDDPKLRETLEKDRAMIDTLGYRMLRVGEMVKFYGQPEQGLSDMEGYGKVDAAREVLLDPDQTQAAQSILLSSAAQRRIVTQTLQTQFREAWETSGVPQAQWYTLASQGVGDLTEFLAETYAIKDGAIDPLSGVAASRIAHLPLGVNAASWVGGGALQAAATVYLYDNVKFDEGQEWRKPILLGLVGGFAALHLMEGGLAFNRHVLKKNWAAAADKTEFLKGHKLREEITRSAVAPTRDLAGSLTTLMAVASVWDLTGIIYNVKAGDVPKTITSSVNFAADATLLRLQARELTKFLLGNDLDKIANSKIATSKHFLDTVTGDAYKNVYDKKLLELTNGRLVTTATAAEIAEADAAGTKAANRVATFLAKAVVLRANPLGWIVNVAYAATTVANFVTDKNRAQDAVEKHEKSFLIGTGIDSAQADVMKSHGWWNDEIDPGPAGLVQGYNDTGGESGKFVDYINSIPPEKLQQLIEASREIPESLNSAGTLPQTQSEADILRLPTDPTRPDVRLYAPEIRRNDAQGRWEDAKTGMVLDDGVDRWDFDPSLGVAPTMIKSGGQYSVNSYTPQLRLVIDNTGQSQLIAPTSQSGLTNLMRSQGIQEPKQFSETTAAPAPSGKDPLPPPTLPQPPTPSEPSPAPADHKIPANVHVVIEGDSIYGIAGNNPDIVNKIYKNNPWLLPNYEQRPRLNGGERGRNPNQIFIGDEIILPTGYVPPDRHR